jgi:hypothetical protein
MRPAAPVMAIRVISNSLTENLFVSDGQALVHIQSWHITD